MTFANAERRGGSGLQRNAWWGLFAMAALGAVVGLLSLANGVWYQAEGVTGKTISQIAAESDAGSRLSDFAVRIDGLGKSFTGLTPP